VFAEAEALARCGPFVLSHIIQEVFQFDIKSHSHRPVKVSSPRQKPFHEKLVDEFPSRAEKVDWRALLTNNFLTRGRSSLLISGHIFILSFLVCSFSSLFAAFSHKSIYQNITAARSPLVASTVKTRKARKQTRRKRDAELMCRSDTQAIRVRAKVVKRGGGGGGSRLLIESYCSAEQSQRTRAWSQT
jgi:hypothetical protein